MSPSPRGPSKWNPHCYSPGPLGQNDVADPSCHDITGAGDPKLYSPWEGIFNGDKLVKVKRDCLAADRQYISNLRIKDKIVDRPGGGDPGIWLTAGSNYAKDQTTINVDPKMSELAIGYIRKRLDEDHPVSAGVNVAGQNSRNVNGAYVDHWLVLDGYRVNDQGKTFELFATDNAAGLGASHQTTKDSHGELDHGYRIRFVVKPNGLIVKPADPGINLSDARVHPDIVVEYHLAVVQVYVKDVTQGKGRALEADGVPLDIWAGGDSKRGIPNKKRPFTLEDWKRLKLPPLGHK